MAILYAAVFVVSLAFSDLTVARIAGTEGQAAYVIDLFNLTAIGLTAMYVLTGGLQRLTAAGRCYAVFLGWLLIELLFGASRYGGRALGEFRYVLPLFWFFVPLAIEQLRGTAASVEYGTLPLNLIGIAATAGLAMLAIEIVSGGRYYFSAANDVRNGFTDFRGERFLDSYQTFNIAFAGAVALLWTRATRSPNWIPAAVSLFAAAVWTQNRAALIAVIAGLFIIALAERRFAMLGAIAVGAVAVVVLVANVAPDLFARIAASYGSVLRPTIDDSGRWRLLIQLSAFDQAMQNPVFGQGYGGYFRFEFPGADDVLAPPHNQFLVLFLKGGAIAVALVILALTAYSLVLWRRRRSAVFSAKERLMIEGVLLLVVTQWVYGFAYDFVITLGLFLGCAEVLLQRESNRKLRDRGARPSVPQEDRGAVTSASYPHLSV